MPIGYRRLFGPSGRQLAKVAGLLLAIALLPTLAPQGDQSANRKANPAAESHAGQAERRHPRNIKAPAAVSAASDQRDASNQESRHPAVRWLGWLVSVLDRYANLLIMFFTGLLFWVAYLQNRLEKRLAADTGDALDVARRSADAAAALATAAAEANNISRHLFVAQNRPRIAIREALLIKASVQDDGGLHFFMRVTIENTGVSPASNIRQEVNIRPEGGETGTIEDIMKRWIDEQWSKKRRPTVPLSLDPKRPYQSSTGLTIRADNIESYRSINHFGISAYGIVLYELPEFEARFYSAFHVTIRFQHPGQFVPGPLNVSGFIQFPPIMLSS